MSVAAEGFVGRGLVLNVSHAGICCFLHSDQDPLETGREVMFKISLHGRADTLRCVARVAWNVKVEPHSPAAHYGFKWIDGADLKALRLLLQDPASWKSAKQ